MQHVTLRDIEAAQNRIAGKVERTPTIISPSLSERFGVPVWLKHEHRQITGAFKLRGATNAIAQLSPGEKARGVVAASTGNHGRALAHAAKLEGIRAVICMSRLVPENKLAEIRKLGADVKIIGKSQDDAQHEVERLVAEEGLVMVPPFDNAAIIAGQGTIGIEIVEDIPDVTMVLVPLSGGGLAAGIAAVVKALKPECKLVGVSMDRGAAMKASIDAGKPVSVEEFASLADSLGGGIGLDNRYTFSMCADLLDEVILLTEDEIAAGIDHIYGQEREIVEGAAAVGVAALHAGKLSPKGPVVALLSGRNIDMELHRRVISGERDIFGEVAA